MKDSYDKIFMDVKKVLVVLAHPDDMEIVCGGTVKRLTENEIDVRLVVITNGGRGNKDRIDLKEEELAKLRLKEQIKGAKALGIKEGEILNLNLRDGDVNNSIENISQVVKHIREFRPDLIITHNPELFLIEYTKNSGWVNHRDHRAVGSITLDASYPYSRDYNFFPEQISEGLKPHYIHKLLLTDSYPNSLNIDITKYIEFKREALMAHKLGLGEDNIDGFIEDDKVGDKYFERFRYIEIY